MKREIDRIPAATMQILCDYPWPGNVRELENFIERSVIVSKGSILNAPTSELLEVHKANFTNGMEICEQLAPRRPKKTERDLIVKALQEAGGVISGPSGAAARLGLKRTTLLYRMKRVGLG
jgi:hydrogenase-4 transcriptional activator